MIRRLAAAFLLVLGSLIVLGLVNDYNEQREALAIQLELNGDVK